MQTEDKMAIFLYIVGEEQAQKIIRILDSGEIRRLLPALQRVTKPSAELQQNILAEFSFIAISCISISTVFPCIFLSPYNF